MAETQRAARYRHSLASQNGFKSRNYSRLNVLRYSLFSSTEGFPGPIQIRQFWGACSLPFIRVSRLSTDLVSSMFRTCIDNIYVKLLFVSSSSIIVPWVSKEGELPTSQQLRKVNQQRFSVVWG